MKKECKILATIVASFAIAVNGVHASDLTSKITMNDYLGGISTFTKTYDSEKDVNNIVITLNMSKELINTVLNQAPGNASSPASLGGFYIELDPKLDIEGYQFSKENTYYTAKDDFATIKQNIDDKIVTSIENNDLSNYSKVWPFGIMVHYYADSKWNGITDQSNGGKTIKANLMEKLGITDEEDLVYGVNYRLFMYTSYSWLYGFQPVKDGKASGEPEYINISYKINYPVQGAVAGGIVYYPSLENALKVGATDLTVLDEENNDMIKNDYFGALKQSGQTLTLSQKEGDVVKYSWTFDGSKITDETINVNTNITFTQEAPTEILEDVNKEITNYANVSFINFEHSGKLPGTAEVSYYVLDKYTSGTKLFVAHFNETTKKLENVQEVEVDNNGYIKFNVAECSSYVLYTSTGNINTTIDVVENVKTGDINLYTLAIVLIGSVTGLIITAKKILAKSK